MLVKNIKIVLAVTISLSFLCLAQTACKIGPANPPDKPTSSSTPTKSGRKHESTLLTSSEGKKKDPFTLAPEDVTKSNSKKDSTETSKNKQEKDLPNDADTFTLELKKPQVNKKNCFITVKITPGRKGMKLEDFSITASCPENNGTLRGAGGKNTGGGYKYNKDLSKKPKLGDICLVSQNQLLGKEDRSFEQGEAVTFRLRFEPGAGTKKGENYNLTVTVTDNKGNSKTENITLTKK